MSDFHSVFLHVGFFAFTLVILTFLLFVPFYRSFIGCILFGVKVNFWLFMMLALGIHDGYFASASTQAEILRDILYPSTAICGVSLLIVVLRTQIVGRKEHRLETHLFSRVDSEPRS